MARYKLTKTDESQGDKHFYSIECLDEWEITDEDMGYIETLNYHQLEHLLMINRGRNNFILNKRR